MVKDIEEQELEGGYELTTVEKDSNLECSICLYLLRDAMGTPCSHLFCRSCIQKLAGQQGPKAVTFDCPECRRPIEKEKIYPSAFADRLVKGSNVYCTQRTEGCEWIGSLTSFIKQHKDACAFQVIECHHLGCKHSSMKRKMDEHVSECKYQIIECEYCKAPIRMNQVHEHNSFCEKIPIQCPQNQCNISVPKIEIQKHLDQDCQFVVVNCTYAQSGCSVKVLRKYLEEHNENSMRRHMVFLCNKVKHSQLKIQELETSNENMKKEIKRLNNGKGQSESHNTPNKIKRLEVNQSESKSRCNGAKAATVGATAKPPLSNVVPLKPLLIKGIDKWIRKKTSVVIEKSYMGWYDEIFENMLAHKLYRYDNVMVMKCKLSNRKEVMWYSNGKVMQEKACEKYPYYHKDLYHRYIVREITGSLVIDAGTLGTYKRTNSKMFVMHRSAESKIALCNCSVSNRNFCLWTTCSYLSDEFHHDNFAIVCLVKDI